MKIAMIGHKKIPCRSGGVEVVVTELSSHLAAEGHEVTAYDRFHKGEEKGSVYKGVRIINVPTIDSKSLDALIYSFFASIHAAFSDYDVVHYHAEGPCAMLWIPKLFGKHVVATIHGLDWQRAKWGGFASRYLRFGERMAAKHADEVIVLSKNMQQYFLEKYARETNLIPNGIEPARPVEPQIITEKYGLSKDSYILFVGRIVPEKGLHYLLQAFAGIETSLNLVIAGEGSHSDEYYQQIRNTAAADKRVIMPGFVEGQELAELYSNCLFYVQPSEVEGMPISLLEALSYGKRCLVSDIPENTEVITENCFVFGSGNAEALQSELSRVIKLENSHGTISHFPTWDQVCDQTISLYRSVQLHTETRKLSKSIN